MVRKEENFGLLMPLMLILLEYSTVVEEVCLFLENLEL